MWIAGCWSGQLVNASDGSTEPLLFSLALLPVAATPPPTLLGASLTAEGRASLLSPGGGPPPTSPLSFSFTEASTGRVFSGLLTLHPSPTLCGTWRDGGGGGGGGGFGLVLEEPSAAVAGGVWIGESAPAPELAEFFFPTNPIFWMVSVARGRLFGAGFFLDSGDVAGSPVLLFTLSGEGGAGGGPVRFEKAYAGLGADSNVVYEGALERGCLCCAGGGGGGGGGAPCALSTWVLRGLWSNPAAGSRGPFSAALVPPAAALPPPFHTRPPPLCALCGVAPAAGAALWACTGTTAGGGACGGGAPWAVCAGCHVSDLAAAHPHALAPRLATPWVDPLPTLLAAARGARRAAFGLVGEPGAGKSTLAAALVAAVNAREGAGAAVALSMDGFHLPRAALDAGLPPAHPEASECHARRGAPWTFAPAALQARLRAVLQGGAAEVAWPGFDHAVGDPQEGAVSVPASARVVLLEGLYLLHEGDGWDGVRPLLDACFYLDTPPPVARARLLARHQAAWGISGEEAEARVALNDGLNAEVVRAARARADAAVVAAEV